MTEWFDFRVLWLIPGAFVHILIIWVAAEIDKRSPNGLDPDDFRDF